MCSPRHQPERAGDDECDEGHDLEHAGVADARDEQSRDGGPSVADIVDRPEDAVGGAVARASRQVRNQRARRRARDGDANGIYEDRGHGAINPVADETSHIAVPQRETHDDDTASVDAVGQYAHDRPRREGGGRLEGEEPSEL